MTDAEGKEYDETPCWKILLRLMFSHVGLLILVGVVAVGGAYIFIDIELGKEKERYALKQQKALDVNDSSAYLVDLFWSMAGNKSMTFKLWNKTVKNELLNFESFIIEVVSNNNYDGTIDGWDFDWTLPKSLIFTISIMTTIGYGNITPKTFFGKIFVIIYFIMSAPLMLVFLANIGDSMADSFKYIYSRCCCRPCRARRKKSEMVPGQPIKGNRLIDEEVGEEFYMPTSEVNVPIVLNLVLIAFYVMIGAVLFSYWETWDYCTAAYFTFVTLSTVGFGDYVPGKSFGATGAGSLTSSFSATVSMLITILYCVFGMALLSMCINLMQEGIMEKCKWVAQEIGLTKDTSDAPVPVYILREEARQRPNKPMETPEDKQGNKPLARLPPKSAKRPKTAISMSDI